MKTFHLHLVSDSTGETLNAVARACLVQFEDVRAAEHVWSLVRTRGQVEKVVAGIEANPGIVLFTLVDPAIRAIFEEGCRRLQVPSIPVLDPVIATLGNFLGAEVKGLPGRQHVMDAEYFSRIDAMHFVLDHDDGQSAGELEDADIILVGVSRTSKTPTCIYLANRGIRAANVPIVPGCPLPPEVERAAKPLIVGLTKDPKTLVDIRRNRLRMLDQAEETNYIDLEAVKEEVQEARKLCARHAWPVIDVTRRSIEETAAAILQLYSRYRERRDSELTS